MPSYTPPNPLLWSGRTSDAKLYLHEKVHFRSFNDLPMQTTPAFALLGYCCDEGVRRNLGRPGSVEGPDAIRTALAKLPNHLPEETGLIDMGNVHCLEGNMEAVQNQLAHAIAELLQANLFPLVLGGGHDMAYGHFNGIKKHLNSQHKTLGIINFDAHFDLRSNAGRNTSGTPFYQIAQDCKREGTAFNYLCLGVRKDANTKMLFQMAAELGVHYIDNEQFTLQRMESLKEEVSGFIAKVDCIYATIDLDGFSSAYAPGVSAASPMGFSPQLVLEILKILIDSKKLLSLDLAEMNPTYDRDDQTAKLAASLLHFVMHGL